MRRFVLALVAMGGLSFTAAAASAFEPYHSHGDPGCRTPIVVPHRGHYDVLTPHGDHYDVRHAPPANNYWRQPNAYVARPRYEAPIVQPYVQPNVYPSNVYSSAAPQTTFYYSNGRGFSLGLGF